MGAGETEQHGKRRIPSGFRQAARGPTIVAGYWPKDHGEDTRGMKTGSYIDGRWMHPASDRLVRNVNPANPDDVIAEFPAATAADVARAIEAAKAAARSWRETPGPERGRVLWR